MLSGTVGIVTGGASGLGAATVRNLLRNGAKVVVADLPHSREGFLKMAEAEGIDSSVIVEGLSGVSSANSPVLAFAEADVTNTEQVSQALDLAEAAFGDHVSAAVSCAGIAIAKKTLSKERGSDDPPVAHPLEGFSKVINVNLAGTFNVARLSAERMALREPDEDGARGCIINTASVAAYDGQKGQVAYATSKGGVVGMTLPMARELSEFGIRVMTIAPGLFLTPLLEGLPEKVQFELGASVPFPSRLGRPDEYGQLACSILANPMLNGEVIRLDGAVRMPP
eukprot:Nitzschia sp. Nitz4//scaffold66_size103028//89365//90293//NITZ4_004513-RA/size103028-snap-gene-0.147-mRNA-1//-1//CDS//3329556395//8616//frame0